MDTNRPRDLPLVASLEEHEQDRLSVDRPELHGPLLWVSLVFDEIGIACEEVNIARGVGIKRTARFAGRFSVQIAHPEDLPADCARTCHLRNRSYITR